MLKFGKKLIEHLKQNTKNLSQGTFDFGVCNQDVKINHAFTP